MNTYGTLTRKELEQLANNFPKLRLRNKVYKILNDAPKEVDEFQLIGPDEEELGLTGDEE